MFCVNCVTASTTTDIEHQMEIVSGYTQVRSPLKGEYPYDSLFMSHGHNAQFSRPYVTHKLNSAPACSSSPLPCNQQSHQLQMQTVLSSPN
jgi:hypothetical protein